MTEFPGPTATNMRRHPPLHPRAAGGFTLLELTVVLLIVVILTAGVVPSLVGFMSRTHLRSSAWQVAAQLAFTRGYAVNRQLLCRVRLEPGTRVMLAEVEEDPEGAPGEFAPLDTPEMNQTVVSDEFTSMELEAVTLTSTEPTDALYFQPDGRAQGGNVLLDSLGGLKFTLSVTPNTGQVEVLESVAG
ncbi:MAG: type II secretion system protein GspH [Armatimonadetes bacterium CG_4_10_14_0_8_um_filter_66_14]|nr:prepilin-type N-terminal cleavage/methylation domain-containing protein [Armatimonadota bacterium]NCQ31897.1 prepilin-type N-terminal cleavage/methylation domain-containing protein [Armatimonadota bacterium]OIO97145.1 MAG: type II secretion system protein GspH [Armatimonadetes bacterium CG2_30_66_41]PIZ45308.1 MAG: type II secretion system protein GspH [Armatimonadetes bacterium CG_4_10_14_0_8_um_filter_66_14]